MVRLAASGPPIYFAANALYRLASYFLAALYYLWMNHRSMVVWMLHGLSKRLNVRQLEATCLNERQFEAALGFYHMI